MSATPAGYEDFYGDSDDSDYDGFSFSSGPSPAPQSVTLDKPVPAATIAPEQNAVFTPAGGEGIDRDQDESGGGGSEWKPVGLRSESSEDESMKSARKRPGSGSSNKRVRKPSPVKTRDEKPTYDPISEEDLKRAITRGSLANVEKLIEQGVEADKPLAKSLWTPLMYAANAGNPEICQLLLSKGANCNYQKDMYTVLMAACDSTTYKEKELVRCVELLLAAGARIKAYDKWRMSPLSYAAKKGHHLIVELLIQNGADINEQDYMGWTPLAQAANHGHIAVVRVLLDANADTTILDRGNESAADKAYNQGNNVISDLIERKIDPASNGHLESENCSSVAAASAEPSKQGAGYVRYGDLETFLSGLELGSFIDLFKKHEISFFALLTMTDEELQKIGIVQVGVRKKILEAVQDLHTKEMNMSSFEQQTSQQNLRAQDIVLILANSAKHLKCIRSSAQYVRKYLQSIKNIQELSQSMEEAQQMLQQSQEAMMESIHLKSDLVALNHHIGEISCEIAKTAPDLIEESALDLSKRRVRWVSYSLLTVAAITTGIILVRKYRLGDFTS